ncbi:uncharacterized protein PG986_006658 [Apiospora aurea]|uniref:Major facilitator superfamily (MFS) profile domain-containing protein n=1 Tax=Apiospora aurea TaxID=335848 RepID=A0ABR1QAB9_9PEZI
MGFGRHRHRLSVPKHGSVASFSVDIGIKKTGHYAFLMDTTSAREANMSAKNLPPGEAPLNEELREHRSEKYSAFTDLERWVIVAIVCCASLCSNLSAFIFLPALKLLAETFSVSVKPDQPRSHRLHGRGDGGAHISRRCSRRGWETADVSGYPGLVLGVRRIPCLGRLLRAASWPQGPAGAWPVCKQRPIHERSILRVSAVPWSVGSIEATKDAELLSITIAPSLGPILGGALSYAAGWRWVFWFLVTITGPCLVLVVLGLPETARSAVGNGSLPPPVYCRLPAHASSEIHAPLESESQRGFSWKTSTNA